MKNPEIIIISESVFQSWAIDAGTYVMALALIAPGYFLNSSAMQWLGVIIFFVSLGGSSKKIATRMTIAEAKAKLAHLREVGPTGCECAVNPKRKTCANG